MLLTWACAAVAMWWLSASVSMDQLRVLLYGSIAASVPAMWFIPAMLLLTAPLPGLVGAGLLLIANTTRLLVSRSAPARLTARMIARAGMAPAVLGALAFQVGVCLICGGYALAAAGLFVVGSTIWTLASIARGSFQPRRGRKLPHVVFSLVVTVILATLLSAGALDVEAEANLFQTTQTLLQRLTYPPGRGAAEAKVARKPVARPAKDLRSAGRSGVAGVVLRPDNPTERQHIFLSAGPTQVSMTRSLTFPFTGEYHLFLTSSRKVPPDAVVHPGTPLDEAYVANTGSSMETEIFGLDPSAKETLEFKVPATPRSLRVTAIRVLFRRNPAQQDQSTKVAIERFTLVPAIR